MVLPNHPTVNYSCESGVGVEDTVEEVGYLICTLSTELLLPCQKGGFMESVCL